MKKCFRCQQNKPEVDFVRNKNMCRSCKSIYNREHYERNKTKYLEKAKRNNASYIERNRRFVYEYLLSNPCVDCGESNPVLLEFDHQKDKTSTVSSLIHQCASIDTIKTEISKCQVRCANCHRLKTAKELGWWIYKEHSLSQ